MGMAEAIEFLRACGEAELRARRARGTERDDTKFRKTVRALEALTGLPSAGLSRPSSPRPPKLEEALREQAQELHLPSIFAVARYEHGRDDLYRAWIGSFRRGPRGEAMDRNLYVAELDGAWRILASYDGCSTCFGRTTLERGGPCPDCGGTGFQHGQGTKLRRLGRLLEVQRLGPPSDPLARAAYDAIPDGPTPPVPAARADATARGARGAARRAAAKRGPAKQAATKRGSTKRARAKRR